MKRALWVVSCALALGCTPKDSAEAPGGAGSPDPAAAAALAEAPRVKADDEAPKKKTIQPAVAAEEAPPASPRLDTLPKLEELTGKIATHFTGNIGRRIYVQVDKPLYKPGETIWIKSLDLGTRDLTGNAVYQDTLYELVSPKGAAVIKKRVPLQKGMAANDMVLPEGVQGGEYKVRVTARDGKKGIRKIIVSTYQPPRIKKKLEFVRKAHGPGDTVKATIEVKRPTGEPLPNHPLRALITLDGEQLTPVQLTTNADGGGLVRFELPQKIDKGDGLLTVMVDDGGVTESITRRIPIITRKLKFSLFPEGGKLVEGLPSRVYFEAKNMIDKPADVEGRVVDDQGNAVARFESYKNGLGRFEFTPSTGRTYQVEITKPNTITEKYPMPLADEAGCVLRTFDDLDGQETAIRAAVRCTEARDVVVTSMLREQLIDAAALKVPANTAAVVYLQSKDEALNRAQGAARITVFDDGLNPLAERVMFRNRRAGLKVSIKPDQQTYVPREQVALEVTTTDAQGKPVQAELAVAVVDDTVISFADDKKGHLLSKVLLEPEVPGKIEEPKFYFDLKEAKSALAMELLMGTRGWRTFNWERVKNPPLPLATATGTAFGVGGLGLRGVGRGGGGVAEGNIGLGRIGGIGRGKGAGAGFGRGAPRAANKRRAVRPRPRPQAAPAPAIPEPAAAQPPAPPPPPAAMAKAEKKADPKPMAFRARRAAVRDLPPREAPMDKMDDMLAEIEEEPPMLGDAADMDWAGAVAKPVANAWSAPMAPVRVFPAPSYPLEYDGPRTDFRETIHWAPAVRTGADGKATVTFHTSDAITSFRVFAEGVGAGQLGRLEEVIKSKLPFSMDIKLPVAVSQGDTIELPLVLSNERKNALPLSLSASFGDQLKLQKPVTLGKAALDPEQRASLWYPLEVTGTRGDSEVMISANAGGLSDAFVRTVNIEPLGFPQLEEAGGTLSNAGVKHSFDLSPATPGTIDATIKLYPSPIATMTGGLAGIIRSPSGCFEQTSSSNYPNVMVLRYLQANDVADPALVARTTKLLDKGYNRLVGYETKDKGFEWFGSSPPHEALTAYGVLQFLDMQTVYGSVDQSMLDRTVAFLEKRRDGKGGFQRNSKALDSFGRASPEVTDAYITWAIAEAGLHGKFPAEMKRQTTLAATTKDPYLLGLATNSLLATKAMPAEAQAAAGRLAGMQAATGEWNGADHSITRSRGKNLHIETTALALMALMEAGRHDDAVRKGVEWLNKNRGGFGQWGATQATVLSLEAMTEYAERNRKTKNPGTVSVWIDGKEVASKAYAAGRRDPLEFTDIGQYLTPGARTIELRLDGADRLPYSLAVEYRAQNPATDPQAAVSIATTLDRTEAKMGEPVRLVATVTNKGAEGLPMTLARVGFPGGLTFQTWQLKELKEKGIIAFYETRAREVILYFRDMKPSEVKQVPIDLVAMVPGQFTGPASTAYLYYTDDQKHWAPGLRVAITR